MSSIAFCLLKGDARCESPSRVECDGAALVEPITNLTRQELRRHHRRYPDIGPEDCRHAFEPFRRDADDCKRHAIESDRLADHRGIAAEASLPEPVANHDHWMCAGCSILVGAKKPTRGWPDAEHVEVVASDELHEDAFRTGARREIEGLRIGVAGEVAERVIACAQVGEIRVGQWQQIAKAGGIVRVERETATNSDGCATGKGWRKSVLISVNIVVFAPIPSESDRRPSE